MHGSKELSKCWVRKQHSTCKAVSSQLNFCAPGDVSHQIIRDATLTIQISQKEGWRGDGVQNRVSVAHTPSVRTIHT